jgi:hypothetical protein
MVWNWNRRGSRVSSALHHDVTATLPDPFEIVPFQNCAHFQT